MYMYVYIYIFIYILAKWYLVKNVQWDQLFLDIQYCLQFPYK